MNAITKPNYLISVLTNKCPRCRKGDIFETKNAYNFKDITKMPKNCAVCGQPTEIEVGFYYGTGYVSYALSIAFSVAFFIAWKVLIGITLAIDDNRIFYFMGAYIIIILAIQPLLMRLSRSIWLSWFVPYNAEWQLHNPQKTERTIEAYKAN